MVIGCVLCLEYILEFFVFYYCFSIINFWRVDVVSFKRGWCWCLFYCCLRCSGCLGFVVGTVYVFRFFDIFGGFFCFRLVSGSW